MSKAVKKSSAPLFVAYGSKPNYHEMQSTVIGKDDMLKYVEYSSQLNAGKFEEGEILCEVVPLGFFYKDENGNVVQGDVKPDALVGMVKLQSDIYEGIAEHVPTPKYERDRSQREELMEELHVRLEGTRHFAGCDGTLDKYGVEEALIHVKGYNPWDISWDGDYCVIDNGYDAFSVTPCGAYHGRAVYEPWDVDQIPCAVLA